MTKGGKNLILLGLGSIFIALLTSGVSLAIYHNSGDIYLDRSRPGFLPDETELEGKGEEMNYAFSELGEEITSEEIEELLNEADLLQEKLNAVPDPFSPETLSDAALNISK